MRLRLRIAVLLASAGTALVGASATHAAPPANDAFENATAIGGLPFSETLNLSLASIGSDDPICGAVYERRSVWYSFTATLERGIRFDSSASSSRIALYTGPRAALNQVACSGQHSGVSVVVQPGTQYFVQLAGQGPATLSAATYQLETSLTLKATPAKLLDSNENLFGVDYGKKVRLLAHLSAHPDMANRVVSIYGTPYGGSRAAVASGPVDASGNFVFDFKAVRRTVYDAVYAGEERFEAAATEDPLELVVRPVVTITLHGFYKSGPKYKLYRAGASPVVLVKVAPNFAGKTVKVELVAGRRYWETIDGTFRLRANGTVAVAVIRPPPGVAFRIRAGFDGDPSYEGWTYSPWKYFKVVKRKT